MSSIRDTVESRFTFCLSLKSLIMSDIPIGFLPNADVTGRPSSHLIQIISSLMHDMAIIVQGAIAKEGPFFWSDEEITFHKKN